MANMELTLDVSNLEPVKQMAQILADNLKDERIPEAIRLEYMERYNAIEWGGGR